MAISYKIYENNVFKETVTGLTATITDLKPNTKYTFHVTETDGDDESAKSNVVEFTTGEIPVETVTLNSATKSIAKGATFQLTATVAPSNATDKTVTWTTNNAEVATVSNTGLITGIKSGTAQIKAATSNGKFATCDVTVTAIVKAPIELVASNVTATSVKLEWKKGV